MTFYIDLRLTSLEAKRIKLKLDDVVLSFCLTHYQQNKDWCDVPSTNIYFQCRAIKLKTTVIPYF